MATDLLNYTGNANLGTGSNPQIPVSTTKDLDVINQTADRLQSQNAARNYQIFQAKLKERDDLYKMLDAGEIKVGSILPQDRKRIQDALDKQTEAFMKWQKKGLHDTEGLMNYKKATQEAQLDATHAQARYVFDKAEQAALASEKLPRKQDARKKNLDSVLSGFGNELKPYQQTLDFDFDPFKEYVTKTTVEETDPKNNLMKVKKTTVSVPATFQKSQKDFLENGEARESQTALLKEYQAMTPDELGQNITAMNNRLKPFGAEIKAHVNPATGQIVIEESIPDFAAKWAMASDPQLSSATSEFDKDLGAYKLGQQRNAIAGQNAAANMKRANAYVALQNKKLSQLNQEEKRVKNFWDGVTGKVRSESSGDVVYASDIPKGYQYVGGLDQNGKPIRLTPKKTSGGKEYYETRYFDSSGAVTDPRVMYKDYIDFQRKSNSSVETYDALLQKLLKSGKINMELVGENGVGNFETAGQVSRAISNKGTTKGEEPIFSDDQQEE